MEREGAVGLVSLMGHSRTTHAVRRRFVTRVGVGRWTSVMQARPARAMVATGEILEARRIPMWTPGGTVVSVLMALRMVVETEALAPNAVAAPTRNAPGFHLPNASGCPAGLIVGISSARQPWTAG